jgi:2-oxoglutarate ferredoxin oxidoreductase subunit delta
MNFRLLIDQNRCKGCALCVSVCPRSVLGMARELNAAGYHYPRVEQADRCTGCAQCALICPDAAIEIEETAARPRRRAPGKEGK